MAYTSHMIWPPFTSLTPLVLFFLWPVCSRALPSCPSRGLTSPTCSTSFACAVCSAFHVLPPSIWLSVSPYSALCSTTSSSMRLWPPIKQTAISTTQPNNSIPFVYILLYYLSILLFLFIYLYYSYIFFLSWSLQLLMCLYHLLLIVCFVPYLFLLDGI